MPFLLLWSLRPAHLRTVALAVTLATLLTAAAGPTAVRADLDTIPGIAEPSVDARAQVLAPSPDASVFCPRPTGRWWEDHAAAACAELLAGRDLATPLTDVELRWLDLGGLPAFATVDTGAIAASLDTYVQRIADEAAAQVTQRIASPTTRAPRPREGDLPPVPGPPPGEWGGWGGWDGESYEDMLARHREEYEVRLATEIAILEAGIARNWDEAETARQRVLAGAQSASFPFYGWMSASTSPDLMTGREVDHRPLVEHVGSACPAGWMSHGMGYALQAHDPITITVQCT
jgi:hypothetical protein